MTAFSNVIGFDDAPFSPQDSGDVPVVGAVFAAERLDGILVGHVTKDGFDAAERLCDLILKSRFRQHIQLILLQGITLAGFNVVDPFGLHAALDVPIVVVSRRRPDVDAVKNALLTRIPNGEEKWEIIRRLGPMHDAGNVYVQSVGIGTDVASDVVRRFSVYGHMPEPIRTAHLIAGALAEGESRGSS